MPECLCPACGEKQSDTSGRCRTCAAGLLLQGRYLLLAVIGENQALTYLAFDRQTARRVVIKELAIHKMKTWKEEELFLREVEVLRQLDHPRIPRCLDYFRVDSGKHYIHYLVQQFMRGVSLKEEFVTRRYTDREVLATVIEVLGILVYLQGLNPPLIHRDIKLSNIMRLKRGGLALIDFGTVKEWFRKSVSGDTVAGTFGFMAPEQFYGEGRPQTDIYAVGVTALVLLTRLSPDKMMNERNLLDWKGFVDPARPIARLLDAFLKPDPLTRPRAAAVALEIARRALDESGGATTEPVGSLPVGPSAPVTLTEVSDHRPPADTWARLVREFGELPVEYGPHFPVDAREKPYLVLVPEILMPPQLKRTEKLVCVFDERIKVLERIRDRVRAVEFGLDAVVRIVHGEILLYSWLSVTADGQSLEIPYNTVDDEVFNPVIHTVRRKMFGESGLRYDHQRHERELLKLGFLRNVDYKFHHRGRRVVLPGSVILGSLYQPDHSAFRAHLPTALCILTDRELIVLREQDRERGLKTSRHGVISTYVPLKKISRINFGNGGVQAVLENGVVLSIALARGHAGLPAFKAAFAEAGLPLTGR